MDNERYTGRIRGRIPADGTICMDDLSVDCVEEETVNYMDFNNSIRDTVVRARPIYEESRVTCRFCRQEVYIGNVLSFQGEYVCDDCYRTRDDLAMCDSCGIILNVVDGRENCGKFFCQDCFEEVKRDIYANVLGYHRFDDWHFQYTKGEQAHNLVTGVELEVEHVYGNEIQQNDVVWELNKMLGFNTICSRDGSINDGFEIVSQPFSLAFIRENEETIKKALNFLIENGYRGDQVDTCGLHLHINRKAFGNTKKEQNENIDKLILFFETYKQELFRFSRRSASKLQRWAKFLSDYKHVNVNEDSNEAKRLKSLDYIGKTKSSIGERYCAVNLMNDNTVEIRIFKSSLNYKTLFATIELIHTLVRRIVNAENISDFNWNNVVNDEDCRYLKEYCDLRGIETDKELIDYSEWYRELMTERNKVTIEKFINDTKSLLGRMYKYYKRNNNMAPILTTWLIGVKETNLNCAEYENNEDEYQTLSELIVALYNYMRDWADGRSLLITYQKEIVRLKNMKGRIEEGCV